MIGFPVCHSLFLVVRLLSGTCAWPRASRNCDAGVNANVASWAQWTQKKTLDLAVLEQLAAFGGGGEGGRKREGRPVSNAWFHGGSNLCNANRVLKRVHFSASRRTLGSKPLETGFGGEPQSKAGQFKFRCVCDKIWGPPKVSRVSFWFRLPNFARFGASGLLGRCPSLEHRGSIRGAGLGLKTVSGRTRSKPGR